MSWQNVIALAIFVGVCGFIAYAGDILGMRMGKRRLTLFGMRPRYTAILTTTVTGMLIAVFTITIMAMTSKQIRVLVLRGAVIAQEYQAAREASKKAQSEAKKAIKQRDVLAADIERVTENLNSLQTTLRKNEAALAQSERKLSAANKEVAKRLEEIADLKKQQDRLVQGLNTLASDMGEAASKWRIYIALRQKPIIFRSNEEIARRVIRCAQSKFEIRAELMGLINEADERAKSKGASLGENNRTVEILPKKSSTHGRFLRESESIDALVDNISSGSGSVVARIVSVGNSVEGEQAMIEFMLNYNELVYFSGEEIASTTIDGGASRGQIFGNLIAFLKNEVRSTAIRKGVIPSYDEDGNPSVGQIAWDQLFELLDRVKTAGKPVRVRALAASETWSAGPLDLNLVVSDSQ